MYGSFIGCPDEARVTERTVRLENLRVDSISQTEGPRVSSEEGGREIEPAHAQSKDTRWSEMGWRVCGC